MIKRIEEGILNIFFPRICVGCNKIGSWVCENCANSLSESRSSTVNQTIHLFSFKNELIREMLHNLKYNGIYEIAVVFGEIIRKNNLLHKISQDIKPGSVLVPVPTSKERLKTRGYNQAELLATSISPILGCEIRTDILIKKNGQKSQVGKNRDERLAAQKNQFSINSGFKEIKRNPIILLDDVYTTGSTVSACTTILEESGWRQITRLVLAAE